MSSKVQWCMCMYGVCVCVCVSVYLCVLRQAVVEVAIRGSSSRGGEESSVGVEACQPGVLYGGSDGGLGLLLSRQLKTVSVCWQVLARW